VKNGNHQELGWPQTAYGVSKIGVTLMTFIQHRELSADSSKPDVVINAVSCGCLINVQSFTVYIARNLQKDF